MICSFYDLVTLSEVRGSLQSTALAEEIEKLEWERLLFDVGKL